MNFNDFTKKLDPDYIPSITESIDLEEKNVPTNPALWSRAKALAKKKFDVYPSAYANGWAAKWYKSKGGSWKKEESVEIEEKRDMTKVVGRKVPELSSDARDVLAHAINMSRQGVPGLDVPLATGKNAGKFNDGILISALTFLRNNSSKMTPMGKKYAKEVIKVLGESVELEEKVMKGETAPFVVKQRDGNYITTTQGKKIKYVGREVSKAKRFTKKDAEYFAGMSRGSQVIELDETVEGFASDAQRRAAFASGYKAKGKKGKKEEVEVDEASEKQMMDMLRKEYGKISKVDPGSPTYKKLTDMLDRLAKSNPQLLKKLADAKIKFVSPLALNRVNRMKESRDDFSYLDRQAASQDRDFAAKKFMDALKKAGITAKYHRSLGKVEVEKGDLRKAQGIGKRLKVDKEGVRIDGTLNKSYKGVFDQNTNEQIDEMSAKQHYNKMVAQGKVGGQVVSPIDRKRFPNREREGLEGPYRVKKSGLIYYYDKKAGKYYDPQSDMYLDVKDVMEGTYSSDSRQSGEEKPLIGWMDKFEKALKSMGSSYAKVDPVEALKLYYKGVDPKRAASQLK